MEFDSVLYLVELAPFLKQYFERNCIVTRENFGVNS